MADELVENAEFGKKRKGEEEPILVAQRFLNIYRQIHIFNKERQEQFDNMLLELPSDIRILLSTLPGGSLLLEHIQELEEKRGLVSPNIKNEKMAEAKHEAELLKKSAQPANSSAKSNSNGGGVVIDASFASELSNSLSLALQQTEKRYKDDIKTLTETLTHSIMESQSAIANMMRDILLSSQIGNPSVAKNNILQSNTNASSDNVVINTNNKINQPTLTSVAPKVNLESQPALKDADIKASGKEKESVSDEKTKTSQHLDTVPQTSTKETTISAAPQIKLEDAISESSSKKSKDLTSENIDVTKQENKKTQAENTTSSTVQSQKSVSKSAEKPNIQNSEAKKADEKAKSVGSKTDAKDNVSQKNDKQADTSTSSTTNVGIAAEKSIEVSPKTEDKAIKSTVLPVAEKDEKDVKSTSLGDLTFPINPEQMDSLNESLASASHKERKKLSETDEVMPFVADVPPASDNSLAEKNQPTSTANDEFDALLGDISEDSDNSVDSLFNELQNDKIKETTTAPKAPEIPVKSDVKNNLQQIRQALQESHKPQDKTTNNLHSVTGLSRAADKANTSINIPSFNPDDIVSLDDIPDNPISLDDISDSTFSSYDTKSNAPTPSKTTSSSVNTADNKSDTGDDNWEWEYVDENGNVTDAGDDDWEWEYVDEDGNVTDANDDDWEWEYVEDDADNNNNGNK